MFAAYRMNATVHDMSASAGRARMESALLRLAEARDVAAFEELFGHYGPRIKTMLMRQGCNAEMAEDLVQETMLTVWRKAPLFSPGKGSVSTWVFTIARNIRIDRLRRGAARPYVDIDEYDAPCSQPGSDEKVLAAQQRGMVGEALKVLPPEQREIIELSFVTDLSQSEIAARLGLPLGTVKSRTRLAYKKLRDTLEGRL